MSQLTLEAAIVGLLRLAVADREERIATDPDAKKTEILLAEAGLSHGQIAEATGKRTDAVRMAISRATATTTKTPATAKTARASKPARSRRKA